MDRQVDPRLSFRVRNLARAFAFTFTLTALIVAGMLGLMRASLGPQSTTKVETLELVSTTGASTSATINAYSGDPNTVIAATKGSQVLDTNNGEHWTNIDGATAWYTTPPITTLGANPTVPPGKAGVSNQLLYRTDVPSIYIKTGGTDEDWTQAGISSSGIATTAGSVTYGSGYDGDVTCFDGSSVCLGITPTANTYIMDRMVQASSVTINAGVTVRPNGFPWYVTGTFTVNGRFSDGACNTPTATQGYIAFICDASTYGSSPTRFYPPGGDGGTGDYPSGDHGAAPGGLSYAPLPFVIGGPYQGNGGTGAGGAGQDGPDIWLGGGGGGGNDGTDRTGGRSGQTEQDIVSYSQSASLYPEVLPGGFVDYTHSHKANYGTGGGGGWAIEVTNGFNPSNGGAGGGSVFLAAQVIDGTGQIDSDGEDGAKGLANSTTTNTSGGGGGGGSGGIVFIIYNHLASTVTVEANGGAGGAAGDCTGTCSGPGGVGGSGHAGIVIKDNLSGDGT